MRRTKRVRDRLQRKKRLRSGTPDLTYENTTDDEYGNSSADPLRLDEELEALKQEYVRRTTLSSRSLVAGVESPWWVQDHFQQKKALVGVGDA